MLPTRVATLSVIAGIVGISFLICIIVVLSALQLDFLRALGWHPITAPTMDWPSGLALGPYGAVMTLTFGTTALALAIFGAGSYAWLTHLRMNSRTGAVCAIGIIFAALGMAGLMFDTDPTLTTTQATLHGRLHDASYILLGAGLALWMSCHIRVTGSHPRFRNSAVVTLACLIAMGVGFVLKGLLFYGVFVAMAIWVIMHALQLRRGSSPVH
jgi:hypothetical protein